MSFGDGTFDAKESLSEFNYYLNNPSSGQVRAEVNEFVFVCVFTKFSSVPRAPSLSFGTLLARVSFRSMHVFTPVCVFELNIAFVKCRRHQCNVDRHDAVASQILDSDDRPVAARFAASSRRRAPQHAQPAVGADGLLLALRLRLRSHGRSDRRLRIDAHGHVDEASADSQYANCKPTHDVRSVPCVAGEHSIEYLSFCRCCWFLYIKVVVFCFVSGIACLSR